MGTSHRRDANDHAHSRGDRGVRRAFPSAGLMPHSPGTVQRVVRQIHSVLWELTDLDRAAIHHNGVLIQEFGQLVKRIRSKSHVAANMLRRIRDWLAANGLPLPNGAPATKEPAFMGEFQESIPLLRRWSAVTVAVHESDVVHLQFFLPND